MAKYSNEFKLQVVNYYLEGHGEKHTAKVFSLDHATVRKWATRYVLHGEDGINRRSGITVYPLDFKLNAVRMVISEGLSQKETIRPVESADRFPTHPMAAPVPPIRHRRFESQTERQKAYEEAQET